MPEYRDMDGKLLTMKDALPRSEFMLLWSDGPEVCCRRRNFEPRWSVTRTVNGIQAGYGTVEQVGYAFRRNGSSNDYNTFDEAARRIIEPV